MAEMILITSADMIFSFSASGSPRSFKTFARADFKFNAVHRAIIHFATLSQEPGPTSHARMAGLLSRAELELGVAQNMITPLN